MSSNLTLGSMNKERVLVLTDHMPWGHRSIAKAIYSYLQSGKGEFDVFYEEVKAETLVGNSFYTFSYRFSPKLGKLMYKSGFSKGNYEVIRNVSKLGQKRLIRVINKIKPNLVISTYYLHSHCLQYLREEMGFDFKLWTVVADPWTINPVSFLADVDLNLVYDAVGVKRGMEAGVDKNKLFVTGWWTREEMYKEYEGSKYKKRLGFSDDRPVIFVGGGSLGSNILTRVLPGLLFVKKKVGFVFNSGTDKLSLNLIKEYMSLLKQLRKDKWIEIRNFGWIDNMAETLSACDIVFGKAGPNFLFDCVAAKKPFVSITHIGGQEDGNVELIAKKGLGWVKESPSKLSRFLKYYLKNPEKYNEKYRESIGKERARNFKSKELLLGKVRRELKK